MKQHYDQSKKKLTDIKLQKETELIAQEEQIKSLRNEGITVKKSVEDLIKNSDQKVSDKRMMKFYEQKVNNLFKNFSAKPVAFSNITFNPVPESCEMLGLGQLFTDAETKNIPKCIIKGKNIEFLILAKNNRNQYCTEGGSKVSIELASSKGEITTGEVNDNGDGSYTVSIKAPVTETGEAKLSVYIDGLRIKGSPFTIKVDSKEGTSTKIVNNDGKMGRPWGIAIAENDMWAVTDYTNHCVYIFNSQNVLVHKFGSQGNEKGEFNQPFGVAFDSKNNLYVVDGGNDRVQKFTTSGQYLLQFGKKGSGNGQLRGPFGVATNLDRVYIADFHNKRISVFNTSGQPCFSFGDKHLGGPRDVAISISNHLFVADYTNHRIYTFTLDGKLLSEFGRHGNCKGDLNRPLSITTTSTTREEKILLGDENHCASVFHIDGEFECCLNCTRGACEGQLNCPNGVACKSNSIYVTDWINQRVQIFTLPFQK